MNDPHEWYPRTTLASGYGPSTDERLFRPHQLQRQIRENDLKVCCFSHFSNDTIDPFNVDSLLVTPMWAHYAKYTNFGCAVVFDLDRIIDNINNIDDVDIFHTGAIEYIEDLSSCNQNGTTSLCQTKDVALREMKPHVISTWFKKSKVWNYENEFRIMIDCTDTESKDINCEGAILGIALETRTFNELSNYHKHQLETLSTPVYLVSYDYREGKLESHAL